MKIKPDYHIINNTKICSINLSKNKGLKINTSNNTNSDYLYQTQICNNEGTMLGNAIFGIIKIPVSMFTFSLNVMPAFRNANIGELFILSEIINLMENHLPYIKLYSKEDAIYFYSKYKFEPSITRFSERDSLLKSILQDTTHEVQKFVFKTKNLISKIQENIEPEYQRRFCSDANSIIKPYIQTILNISKDEYKKHSFQNGMDMILKRRTIEENGTFFNKLFNKHEIDYKI